MAHSRHQIVPLGSRASHTHGLKHTTIIGHQAQETATRLGSVASQGHLGSAKTHLTITTRHDGKHDQQGVQTHATEHQHTQVQKQGHHKHDHKGSADIVGDADQGTGDGSGVGGGAGTAAQVDSQGRRVVNLGQGSAFVLHKDPLHLKTQHADIHVAPHSAVYVMQVGKTVSVYNIADGKKGDVDLVTHEDKHIVLPPGEQVLLTSEEEAADFQNSNPITEISSVNVRRLANHKNLKVFNAEFSPVDALDRLPDFQRLITSKDPSERKLADKILKTAAIVLTLRGN